MENLLYLKPLDEHARNHYIRYQMGGATELLLGGALNTPFYKGNDHDAKSTLIKAAQHLLSRDRMLSAVPISEGTRKPYWAGIKSPLRMESLVAIDRCPRSFTSMSSRMDYMNSCYSSGQLDVEDKTIPLWKLVLNRGYDDNESDILIIVISHIVAEGESIRRLFLEVLNFIHSDQKNHNLQDCISPDGTLPIQHSTESPLALEEAFNMRPPLSEILYMKFCGLMLSKYFPTWIYRLLPFDNPLYSRNNEKLKNFVPSLKIGNRVIILPSLYSATKSPFLNSYVSINSLLYNLIHVAMFETFRHFNRQSNLPGTNKDNITMNFMSNTLVRIKSPNKRFQVQNFVGSLRYPQAYNADTLFWDSVKTYHQHIHSEPRVNARFSVHLFEYAGGAAKLLSKLYSQSNNLVQHAIMTFISNVGPVFTADTSQEYENINSSHISNVFLYHQASPTASPTAMYAISVDKTSEISITFCWKTDSVSDEWVDYFENVLHRSVKKIVNRAEKPDLTITVGELAA